MLLSIITVCFNEVQRIRATADSVVLQTNTDFEWIIVDGESTDGTLDELKCYEKHITSLISEKDHGIYDAMNKGLLKAKGEYVLFLNGGDHFTDSNVLKKFSDERRLNTDLVAGNIYVHQQSEVLEWIVPDQIEKSFFIRDTLPHCGTFIRRSCFAEYQLLYDLKYQIAADYDWFSKIGGRPEIEYQKLPFFIANFYKDGISSNQKGLLTKELREIRRDNFTWWFRFSHNCSSNKFCVFIRNSLIHPRFFAGSIKALFFFKLK